MSRKRATAQETPDYAAMLRRMIKGYEHRLAHSNPDDLAEALVLAKYLDQAIAHAVTALREHYNYSWAEIGAGIGTTRQAAFQRFGTPGAVGPENRPHPADHSVDQCEGECTDLAHQVQAQRARSRRTNLAAELLAEKAAAKLLNEQWDAYNADQDRKAAWEREDQRIRDQRGIPTRRGPE